MTSTTSFPRGPHARAIAALALLVLALAACRQEQPGVQAPDAQAPDATAATPADAPAPPPPAALEDVIERDPRYMVGISFPPAAKKYPGLATELQRYADAARAELKTAIDGMGDTPPPAPYELSLGFAMVAETPQVVSVAADGSSYTGGAHGQPLVARFNWLPATDQPLTAAALVPDAKGWREVSDYVHEALHSALSQRLDADELEGSERAQVMRQAAKMIDEGSDPEPENFAQFEPVTGSDGRITALRFVFPPYQVGPYSDGVQTVEVPAAVLLPHVAEAYRPLFSTDAPAPPAAAAATTAG